MDLVRRFISLLSWGLMGLPLAAQQVATPPSLHPTVLPPMVLPLELIDVSDGLSQGYVSQIIEDRQGHLWLGTMDGLNRFDGYSFKVFRNAPDDSTSISGNVASPILDQAGRLIVSCNGGSLDLFEPSTEVFHHFPTQAQQGSGLRGTTNGRTALHPLGVMVSQGIDTWDMVIPPQDSGTYDVRKFDIKPLEQFYPYLWNHIRGKTNWIDHHPSPSGSLWLSQPDSVFWFRHYSDKPAQEAVVMPSPTFHAYQHESNRHCRRDPFMDSQGQVYMLASDTLLQFSLVPPQFKPIMVLPDMQGCITSILPDHAGQFWMMSESGRYIRVDPRLKQVQMIQFRGSEVSEEIKLTSYFDMEDRHHNIWLRTTGYGFLKIPATGRSIQHLPDSDPKKDRSLLIMRILAPGHKALYDPRLQAQWLHVSKRLQFPFQDFEVGVYNVPLAYAHGAFWVVVYETEGNPLTRSHLARVDPQTAQIQLTRSFPGSVHPSLANFLFVDRQGNVWSYYTGLEPKNGYLWVYSPQTDLVRKFELPLAGMITGAVRPSDWYESPAGKIWMASSDGLYCLDPGTGNTRAFTAQGPEPLRLAKNYLHCVQGDPRAPERIIWVGTNGGGLDCIDLEKHQVRHFSTRDGLPNDVIYGLQFDKRNNLWLSTNNGLCLFDPLRMTFRNFDRHDGLAGNEFNHSEFAQDSSGRLYFGGTSGVNHFDPEEFHRIGRPSTLVINSLKLNNKQVEFSREASENKDEFRLLAPMDQTRELVFRHDHPMIGLGFSLLDLTAPGQNKFRYRLLGYQEEWIDAGTSHEAIYTSLSPGSYTFEVVGCNSQNAWTPTPTRLSIVILPPWWGTWWFRVGMAIIVFGAIYGFYRFRLHQILKVERMRNRIGQDLHDEIGSTLSSISLYSAVMQRTSDNLPPQTLGILDKIISSTSQMMESMNDMVWTIKASNDSFDNVVNRMRAYAVNMTEVQEIDMKFIVDPQVEKLSLGMEQRKNIYLIYKEAVNNAVKYAQCSELKIEMQKVQGVLQLTITDNGIGFDPEDKVSREHLLGGNGLGGMKARAAAIEAELEIVSKVGEGTVVRLRART